MDAPTGPDFSAAPSRADGTASAAGVDHACAGQAAVPCHVALTMDGNGRWARQRGLPRLLGHRAGVERVPATLDLLASRGVHYVTLFAFSTENWERPTDEVEGLISLLHETLLRETDLLREKNIRVFHIGWSDRLSSDTREVVQQIQQSTSENTGLVVNVAFDYGGRQEILSAVRQLMREGVAPEAVDEQLFESYLFTAHCPDPDLIIRTGGELRISNFLLWQSAYSEFYYTTTLWPDLDCAELERALTAYRNRQRRFGKISPEA